MLIYQFPPRVDKTTKQLEEFNASVQRKKIRKDGFKNLVLGLILFAISFFVPFVPVKILLYVLTAFYFFLAYMVFHYAKWINTSDSWTKVYDDRIEHSQIGALTSRVIVSTVYFEDIVSSSQNMIGELCIKLKENHKSKLSQTKNGQTTPIEIKDNVISMFFDNPKPKLYLINEMYDRIKYPKKEYNVIEDDEDDEYNSF